MLKCIVLLTILSAAWADLEFPSENESSSEETGGEELTDKFGFNGPTNANNYGGGFRPPNGGGFRPPNGGGFRPPNGGNNGNQRNEGLRVLYSWKQVDFVFTNDSMRQNMLRNQQFIPINNLILDADVYETGNKKRVFVTLPRVRPGVPVTLARVSSKRRNGQNLLRPFPNWEAQTPGNCQNSITSVFRTHIDTCGRLWVLDSGNNNAFNGQGNRIVCNPKVLIYDLQNKDRLIGQYRIPMSMIENNSLLVTIIVDTRRSGCSDAFAYIADSIGYKMIVFNLRTQQFWRINSIHFFPYPDQSRFTVNGVSFDLMGGLFGMTLGPSYRNKRRMYFHCIDSVRQSWVDTANLRNQTMWRDNMNANPRAFNLLGGSRSSQSASAAMDDDGIMYFGLIGSNEIACWDSRRPFNKNNLVSLAKDDTNLQFNSGIKVYGDKLYVTTSRLQNYITRQVKENEDNYRVLEGNTRQMTQGTKCQKNDPLATRVDEYEPDSENVAFPFSL